MSKKSFLIYIDSLDVLDDMSDEEGGKLFKAIKDHQNDVELNLDPLTRIAFAPFKAQFARDDEKYACIVERNKINGLKGGRPKTQPNPNKPTGLIDNPNNPNKPHSDSDSDSDSDKEGPKKKRSVFKKPSPTEIQDYFIEKGYLDNSFGSKFFNHYESNGWMVGKTKMKSWKAAVSNWIARGNYKKAQITPVQTERTEDQKKSQDDEWLEMFRAKNPEVKI